MANEIDFSEKKVITLDELIKRKEEIKAKRKSDAEKTKDFYIETLDALVTVKNPGRLLVLEAADMDEPKASEFLVYNSVVQPNLKDPNLHKEFGVEGHPMKIVNILLGEAEIGLLAQKCMELAADGNSVIDTSVKN